MANSLVTLIRGDATTINNTQILNGQLLFDETNGIIYMDEASTRIQFGGSNSLIEQIAYVETGTTASRGYPKGTYVFVNNILYKAKTQINSGTTFVVNTNIEAETVGAALKRVGELSTTKTGSGTTVTTTIQSGTSIDDCIGTLLNNDNALNTSLGGLKFRVSSGKLQYSTNGQTWIDIGGGTTMKCIATVTGTGNGSVTLSTYNYAPASAEDYFVIVSGLGVFVTNYAQYKECGTPYVTNKTATGFDIVASIAVPENTLNMSWSAQIIALK